MAPAKPIDSLVLGGFAAQFHRRDVLTIRRSQLNSQHTVRSGKRRFSKIRSTPYSTVIFEFERQIVDRHRPFGMRSPVSIYGSFHCHGSSKTRTEGVHERRNQSIAPSLPTRPAIAGIARNATRSGQQKSSHRKHQQPPDRWGQFASLEFHRFASHSSARIEIHQHSHHRVGRVEPRQESSAHTSNTRSKFPNLAGYEKRRSQSQGPPQ